MTTVTLAQVLNCDMNMLVIDSKICNKQINDESVDTCKVTANNYRNYKTQNKSQDRMLTQDQVNSQ